MIAPAQTYWEAMLKPYYREILNNFHYRLRGRIGGFCARAPINLRGWRREIKKNTHTLCRITGELPSFVLSLAGWDLIYIYVANGFWLFGMFPSIRWCDVLVRYIYHKRWVVVAIGWGHSIVGCTFSSGCLVKHERTLRECVLRLITFQNSFECLGECAKKKWI